MHDRKHKLMSVAWLAAALTTAGLFTVGCHTYGGSVPIDNDAGMTSKKMNSVNASVPIDDDAGMEKKPTEPKP